MSYPLQFLVVFIMSLLGCAKVTLQGRASRKFFKNGADSVLFHTMLFLFVALTLVVIFPTALLTWQGFWLSILCALFTFFYQVFYAQALKEGPVSLTVLICNFSTFFVVLYSTIAFGETLYLSHVGGMLLLVLSMILNVKQEEKEKGRRWLLFTLAAMVSTAVGTSIIKAFGKTEAAEVAGSDITFLALSYVAAAVFALGYYILNRYTGKKEKHTFALSWKVLAYAIGIGVVLGVFQKFYALGMQKLDAAFMMPTWAGMQTLGMTTIGIFAFGDKLRPRQKWSIVCGLACIILMNLRIFPLF
ncbi:MAG: EamA family transporter [Clostridia bacterium]|nr:EamA family transporter [Clostridia bacterium]